MFTWLLTVLVVRFLQSTACLCKPETLHYLHVWPAFANVRWSVFGALKCAFLPCKRTVLHIPGILPLTTNVHLSHLIDLLCYRVPIFVQISRNKTWAKTKAGCFGLFRVVVCGWVRVAAIVWVIGLSKRRPVLTCMIPTWYTHEIKKIFVL